MIRLSPFGKMIYQMLGQIVILLNLYAILMLLSAMQSLPNVTFLHQLPLHLITPLSERILHLTLLTGFVTAACMMCLGDSFHLRLAQGLHHTWTALLIATVVLSGFNLAPLLDMLTLALLFGYLGLSLLENQPSPFLRSWQVGIVLVISSMLAQWFVTDSWQIVIDLFRVHVAYGVTGISILFWLMTRWSNVREEWARDGVAIVSGLIALAGLLISFAPLRLSLFISLLSACLVPLCFMILAGHSYRALRDRNHNQSLSPHWIAIAVLLWLAGGGFMGTISTQNGLQAWLQRTRLAEAQQGLMLWGLLAIVLSLVNNTASELRGENRRVTGYMPLWLMAFGNGFGAIVLACAGVVEIYLRNFVLIDQAKVEILLIPLSLLWMICLLMVAIGILIYTLGFWARRPKIITEGL